MRRILYRAIKEPPVGRRDFLSKRELNEECHLDECLCWGLSVWPSLVPIQKH